jgi:hypothetical protein
MNNQIFKVLLSNKVIGVTSLEKADVPMGVLFGHLQLDNIDNGYDFFKSYCLQEHIGFTDDKKDKLITTRHISKLKVIDTDNTEIKGSSISVAGQGKNDFEITIEGVPHNIFGFRFKHHVDHYNNLFDRYVVKDNIVEIGIDNNIGIYIKPEKATFPLIYRSALGIHWDDRNNILYTTNQSGWTHLQWYKQMIGVVRDEYNHELLISDKTIWTNISNDLKKEIIEV